MAIQRLTSVLLGAAGTFLPPVEGYGISDSNSTGFGYRISVQSCN